MNDDSVMHQSKESNTRGSSPASVYSYRDSSDEMCIQRKDKWARLILRELYDLGYEETARALENEAAIRVQTSTMEMLQSYVKKHQWDECIALLRPSDSEKFVRMRSPAATREVMLLLLKNKYLDLLRQNRLNESLETFQKEILHEFELVRF